MAVATLEGTETKTINGSRITRDEAVIKNQKLVKKVAAKYEYKAKLVGLDFKDLVSFGTIGLIKAFDDFDDSLGFRFSTYAVPKIKGEVTKSINRSNIGVYYPVNVRRDVDMIQTRKLEECSIEDISKQLSINTNRVKYALEFIKQGAPNSLETKLRVKGRDKEISLLSMLGTDQDFSSAVVSEFLKTLDDKELDIMRLRFEDNSFQEISKIYGVTQQAVSYYLGRIRNKWLLYQYGLPVPKKKKELLKLFRYLDRIQAGKGDFDNDTV